MARLSRAEGFIGVLSLRTGKQVWAGKADRVPGTPSFSPSGSWVCGRSREGPTRGGEAGLPVQPSPLGWKAKLQLWASLVAQMVKNLPPVQEAWV